ncbi:MAG: ankyrin repeat domain-containing protein [Rhodocyclaceae bacterium]|jgi:hypothetical protein|nr:ankyrin repeat domain-containing protein [Rhodocyclaceae bacterium]
MSKTFPLRPLVLALCLVLAQPAVAGIYDDILAAANQDDTAQVIDLLKRGMDVNTTDPSGNTLLMIAARNGNADLLDFLIGNRSNLQKRNRYGDSAVMMAAFRGHLAIVRKLLDAGADIRNSGWNALHYSAYGGFTEIVRLLVERKADLDVAAPNGQTALMLAAATGKLDVVRILIDADADMDLLDYEGQSAIMLAEKAGFADVTEYLRESGAEE